MTIATGTLVELTADIVSAHVSHNDVPVDRVANVIEGVFTALQSLGEEAVPAEDKPVGAVSIRSSIKPGHLVSMIDGKPTRCSSDI